MARQERAEQTRRSLMEAAAHVFDDVGYEAAALNAISSTAGVSKGALTFHFASKAELADAVQALSCRRARHAIAKVAHAQLPALQAVIDVTHTLADILQQDRVTRAGLRLSRERGPVAGAAMDWDRTWTKPVRTWLLEARSDRSLPGDADVHAVAAFVAHLIAGLEITTRHRGILAEVIPACASGTTSDSRAWLTRVWKLVLPDIAIEPADFQPQASSSLL
ncbi:ScbR family autoregulator-binding transcription factor [Streptomyces sp. NBC_00009]|uniref:ScbR family autoregulator-binding transcription factor n=1 Tax=Streptomyces sp. NBC_00009 TaxID=2975620 RepID=UPI003247214E